MRLAALCALLFALSGCRTRPDELVSTQSCVTHTREALALASLGAVSDFGTSQARISVSLPLRSCDAEADAGAALGGDGRMHVHAAVWRSTADCGATRTVERALVVPAGRFDFVDDTSGNDLGARPCVFDRDCPESLRPRCTTETSVHFVCYSTADDCCTADSCGAGFTCSGCTCRPLGAAGGECRCDADCTSGICGDGTCVTPA